MIHRDFGATLRNTNFGIHFHRRDAEDAEHLIYFFFCDLCVSSEALRSGMPARAVNAHFPARIA
jgi:hypothetical protein